MEIFAISLIAISAISTTMAIGYLTTGKHEEPLVRIHGVISAVTIDFIQFDRAGENAAHIKEVIAEAAAEERKNGEHAHYKWKKAARHVEQLPRNLGKNTAHAIHKHIDELKEHNPYWADTSPRKAR